MGTRSVTLALESPEHLQAHPGRRGHQAGAHRSAAALEAWGPGDL